MKREAEIRIVERLLEVVNSGEPTMAADDFRIPVAHYTSQARFEEERDVLFRRYPLAIGHASEVAKPGDYLTSSAPGVPLVVVRDAEGQLRAFLNVCRHRGTRLVSEPCGHDRKAFVCPYHHWTYDLAGGLIHIPQEKGFPSVDRSRYGLSSVPVESRFGLLWLRPGPEDGGKPMDVAGYLGGFGEDLTDLGLDRHVLHRRVSHRKKTNWKLLMDAFLESYHIRALHRSSIYPFFLDNVAVSDVVAPHIRGAVGRKALLEAKGLPEEQWSFRSMVSMAYFLFPNTILVLHPDYVSQLSFIPEGPDSTHYTHSMLIPAEPRTEKERQHWEKTFDLIENNVFQKEDVATAESIQEGLLSGANEALTFGRFEHTVRIFHGFITEALADAKASLATRISQA
jgi:Rieske 2Fe-2S family protein